MKNVFLHDFTNSHINDDIKKGRLENHFVLLSEDLEKIEKYKKQLLVFNKLIISQVKNKQLKDSYVEEFDKIQFKDYLDNSLSSSDGHSKSKQIKV